MLRIQFVYLAISIWLAVTSSVDGFVPATHQKPQSRLSMTRKEDDGRENLRDSRRLAIAGVTSFVAAATIFLAPFNNFALALEEDVVAAAADEASPPVTTIVEAPKYSIAKCTVSSKAPVCISTSNVRQLDLYAPPWTFSSTADEAMARLKGAIETEPLNSIVSSEDNTSRHLLVDSKRSKLGTTAYRMEFVINADDSVITFRSSAPSDITGPDFGLQRKRLSEIRERAGSFGVMGEGLDSADSKSNAEKGYGPLGQLKSFYGLQSGAGFEDVLTK